jgi:hypothetical protein
VLALLLLYNLLYNPFFVPLRYSLVVILLRIVVNLIFLSKVGYSGISSLYCLGLGISFKFDNLTH